VAHGGVRFVQSLARLCVVDEYRLYVYPIAIGSGSSLFAGIEGPQPLRLVSNTRFPLVLSSWFMSVLATSIIARDQRLWQKRQASACPHSFATCV
jgi:dihydrofolate reductase